MEQITYTSKAAPTPKVATSTSTARKHQRRREQAACRSYWQRLYGIEAEHRSRGGIAWLE